MTIDGTINAREKETKLRRGYAETGVPPYSPLTRRRVTIRRASGVNYISYFSIDYITQPCYIASHPRSSRGVSGDDPEGGAGSGVLRRRLVKPTPGWGYGAHATTKPAGARRAAAARPI